ncbi:MAG: hypothetical protein AB9869_32840 [Verrucomicrobiia bacterium]
MRDYCLQAAHTPEMAEQDAAAGKAEFPQVTTAEFLESHPPGQFVQLTDIEEPESPNLEMYLRIPQLLLHCTSDCCNGPRFFRARQERQQLDSERETNLFLFYRCANCKTSEKVFAVSVSRAGNPIIGYKFGEFPAFGPPTPARFIRLIQPDRELFLKGRQCENHGLGVGAFTYYRRVVEQQKNRVLREVRKVAERIGAKPEQLACLDQATEEIQFTKAVDMAKTAIPESLLISGQNPLTLLHSALSAGVHELSDETCLELATDIRVVLIELSERIAAALKDEAELDRAVSRLVNRGNFQDPEQLPKPIGS